MRINLNGVGRLNTILYFTAFNCKAKGTKTIYEMKVNVFTLFIFYVDVVLSVFVVKDKLLGFGPDFPQIILKRF